MKNEECIQKNFEGCVKICNKSGETIRNCIELCTDAAKHSCSKKTKLGVETKCFNTYVETESNKKGWALIAMFGIIVSVAFILLTFIF